MFIGVASFKVVSLIYTYLFFYFAAGCYYKQQILWDKGIFVAAGVRFLAAVGLFLTSIVMATLVINSGIYFFRISFPSMSGEILFTVFFIVPSFAFVSEITGKNRSLLTTFAKTRGNLIKIGMVAFGAFIFLMAAMIILSRAHFLTATIVRAAVLVYISIAYFKMYDFFYGLPQNRRPRKNESKMSAAVLTDKTEGENNANER